MNLIIKPSPSTSEQCKGAGQVTSSTFIVANVKSSDLRKVRGLTIDNEYQWFEGSSGDEPTTGRP